MSSPAPQEIEKGSSLWHDAWLRLRKNRAAIVCLVFLIIIASSCVVLPVFTIHEGGEGMIAKMSFLKDPSLMNLPNKNMPPSAEHWFGTDHLGRDIFSRVLYGGRVSLLVGLVTTCVALVIGTLVGATAGYAGGRLDTFLMRVVDVLYSLPFLVIVILLATAMKPVTDGLTDLVIEKTNWSRKAVEPVTTLVPLFMAIGALSWLNLARIVRSQVQDLVKREFVEAARSLGLGHVRILFRHILPNALGPVIVYTTLTVPGVMLFEASLSFLGLGIKPPNSSWGTLIQEGADRMVSNPWLLAFPAVFFSSTLLALNFLGDGLRDALDPKSSKD
jgi:oligopeptide transport system permease protein